MKRIIATILLAAICSQASAQPKVLGLRGTLGNDAAQQLHCERGVDPTFASGNNVTRLEGGMGSTSERYGTYVPGGDWELPTTLTTPNVWGPSLSGAGGITSGALGDNHYIFGGSVHGSPQVTRFIWKGADDGTMAETTGAGYVLSGLNFQGCRIAGAGPEPTGGVYPNRAKLGLHIQPSSGSNRVGAKCLLEHLAFTQMTFGILIGSNLDDIGAADYTGDDASHADTIYAGDLHFWHPTTGEHAGEGTCLIVRNEQSVNNVFGAIHSAGNPEYIVHIERGGKTQIGMIGSSGDTTALRVGLIDSNCGVITVGMISLDGNTAAKMLRGDRYDSSIATPTVVIQSAAIPESITAVPQVDVGPGSWVIQNCNYLRADSIVMEGKTVGGSDRICHIHLENVGIINTNLAGLIDSMTGPCVLTWRNCRRYHDGNTPFNWGLLFEDSTSATEITSGDADRLPIDYVP